MGLFDPLLGFCAFGMGGLIMQMELLKFSQEEKNLVYNLLTDSRHEFGLTANSVAAIGGFSKATFYKIANLTVGNEDLMMRGAIACRMSYRNFLVYCEAAHVFMSEKSPRCKIIMEYLRCTPREEFSIHALNYELVRSGYKEI